MSFVTEGLSNSVRTNFIVPRLQIIAIVASVILIPRPCPATERSLCLRHKEYSVVEMSTLQETDSARDLRFQFLPETTGPNRGESNSCLKCQLIVSSSGGAQYIGTLAIKLHLNTR